MMSEKEEKSSQESDGETCPTEHIGSRILKLVPTKQVTEEHGKGLDQNWAGEGSTQWKSAAAIQWPCCSH